MISKTIYPLYDFVTQHDYTPFGSILPVATGTVRLSFIGKEKDLENSLGDFGVRKYDDEIGRFTSIDPLSEKYYGLSPYHYCGNNPVSLVDGNGKYIIATNDFAQNLITSSVESKYEGMVSFNLDGSLNTQNIQGVQIPESTNMGKLLFLHNNISDKIIIDAKSGDELFKERIYSLQENTMMIIESSLDKSETNGLFLAGPQSDGKGNRIFYDNIAMSPNNNSYIFLNKELEGSSGASTTAHELFYHSYLYYNKKHKSHKNWFRDSFPIIINSNYDSQLDGKVRQDANK